MISTMTKLIKEMKRFIDTYNGEIDQLETDRSSDATIDNFVTYDDTRIKWSRNLKTRFAEVERMLSYSDDRIQAISFIALLQSSGLFFDPILNNR